MLNPASVVLITGASRGLGRGIALEIAKSGGSAMITFAVHAAAAEETVALLTSEDAGTCPRCSSKRLTEIGAIRLCPGRYRLRHGPNISP